ncbi:uncharacterized protein LOC120668488 [Panicum virgatum]|uniref:Uncharacterized protein n=1 Tax=Panicum virgatum TaxID=38727 RepID=A0A8T0T609_PANVG|nr:uncharacterized protein LOC120668488 [Panicum virgatum]KAG2605717.1 hypothetical protein PVAP13_4NG094900 [Panicum virgatum]
MILGAPTAHHVLHHLPVRPPGPGPGYRGGRRLLSTAAHAAARRDDDATAGGAEPAQGSSSGPESLRLTALATTDTMAAPAGLLPLCKDYSHTLFRSECLEVLGMVDLESLRRRPRITVGVTVKASVVLPVLVVLAVLYLTDMAKGVVDWTHHLEGEDVKGD